MNYLLYDADGRPLPSERLASVGSSIVVDEQRYRGTSSAPLVEDIDYLVIGPDDYYLLGREVASGAYLAFPLEVFYLEDVRTPEGRVVDLVFHTTRLTGVTLTSRAYRLSIEYGRLTMTPISYPFILHSSSGMPSGASRNSLRSHDKLRVSGEQWPYYTLTTLTEAPFFGSRHQEVSAIVTGLVRAEEVVFDGALVTPLLDVDGRLYQVPSFPTSASNFSSFTPSEGWVSILDDDSRVVMRREGEGEPKRGERSDASHDQREWAKLTQPDHLLRSRHQGAIEVVEPRDFSLVWMILLIVLLLAIVALIITYALGNKVAATRIDPLLA
jgi:hypothetical protein